MGRMTGLYIQDKETEKRISVLDLYGSNPFFDGLKDFAIEIGLNGLDDTDIQIGLESIERIRNYFLNLSKNFLDKFINKAVYELKGNLMFMLPKNDDNDYYEDYELVHGSNDLFLSYYASDIAAKISIIKEPLEYEFLNKGYDFYIYLSY